MHHDKNIRESTQADISRLMHVIDAVELFPSTMLEGMMTSFLSGNRQTPEFWLTDDHDGPVGVAYCAPERLTEGTWNLYLIAVHPGWQRKGRGAALIRAVEGRVTAAGGRLLLIETSGLGSFEGQRDFYARQGYSQEARVRDFYDVGNDKIVFWKLLSPYSPRNGTAR